MVIVGVRYVLYEDRRRLAVFLPDPELRVTPADIEWARLYGVPDEYEVSPAEPDPQPPKGAA